MRRFAVGLLIVVSAVCLVLSSTSLWTRRHVVNTDVFVAGGQAILADPAVQGVIDAKVVDTMMANPEVQGAANDGAAQLPPRLQRFKPAPEDEARDLLSSGVHAVLTSDRSTVLTETALRSVQTQLLTGQPVKFTLGQAKARIPQQDRTGVINLGPDDVGFTVLTPQQAPQLYTAIDLLKTLWLWVGLLGLAALIGALEISRRRRRTLRAWSVTTAVLGLLLVIAMRVAQGPLLIHVKPANAAAATAIYEGVTASLRAWTLWFVAIPVVVLVFTLLWGRLGIIPGIGRGYRAAVEQVRSRREAHELAQDAAIDGIDPRPAESWTHRVAADTRTFIDGVGMSSWLDRLGGFVRRHLPSARWAGVAAGALVLLLWPAPTLTVQIWVVALIALYLGLLEWPQSRAAGRVTIPGHADAVRPHPRHRPTGQRPPEYRRPRRPVPRRGRTCRPWAAGSTCSCGWVKPERAACSPTTSSLKRRPTCWRHRHRIRDQPGAQPPPGVGSSMSRPPAGDATSATTRPSGPPEAQPGAPGWTAEAMSGQPDLPDQ